MRTAVLATAVTFAIGLAMAGEADAAIKRYTNIPAQNLGPALRSLAQERNFQIIYASQDVADLRSPGAVGELTANQALEQLLGGTGFTYRYLDERTVTILPLDSGVSESMATQSGAPIPESTDSSQSSATSDESSARGPSFWDRIRLAQADRAPKSSESSATRSGVREGSTLGLEEIVVTAQKRSERLQDVPISISVLTGEDLDRSPVEGITEALNRVSGVATTLGPQGGGTQVSIRGVSASAATFFGSSPIAYYLDSVPFGFVKTAVAPDSNAYDLERVEVLRGPQGTLYGASAQNGVVRVLSKDADLDELGFKARTSISSTHDGGENYRGDMAVNVPLVEGKLAARAVVGYQGLSGWIEGPSKSDVNDAQLRNVRLKLNAAPTENLSIGLSAWTSRADYGGPSLADDEGRTRAILDQPVSTDYDAYGLKIGYEFASVALTSMTSYLDYANDSLLDWRVFAAEDALFGALDSSVFAQEINVQSTHGGPWRWSFGGIYRDAEDRLLQTLACCLPGGVNDQRDFSESVAVFGELTRIFLDGRLELTGGLRYFEDDVRSSGLTQLPPPAPPVFESERTFTATSPRVVLTWHPSSRATIYASYGEGFRSGFDQGATVKIIAPDFPPVEADILKNHELGAKVTAWDGRLVLDTALYYIDWQDVQQSVTVLVGSGDAGFNALINGPSASGMGFDFAATAQPVKGLELGINFSWNELEMDERVESANFLGQPVDLFAEGDRLNNSPEYIVGASTDYIFALAGGFEGQFAASANYISEQDFRGILVGLEIGRGDSMLIGRASFALRAPQRWTATLFADNITNERGSPLRPPWLTTGDWDTRVRPRTLGLQLEYSF